MHGIRRRDGLTMIGAAALLGAGARAEPAGGTLGVIEKGEGRLAFYALPDGRPLGAVALGPQPHEIVADRGGRFAWVGSYGVESWKVPGDGGHAIWQIDLAHRALARTIDVTPYRRIHAVRLDARGRLFALAETDSLLMRFDRPAEDAAPARLVPLGGARSHYMLVSRDGTRVFVADTMGGTVILAFPDDPARAPIRRTIGEAPEALALSPDESLLYAIDRPTGMLHALDATTLAPRARRTLRGEAVRVVTQPDGRLIVSNQADRSLSRLAPGTLAEQDRLPLPAPAPGLTLPAGSTTLFAALEDGRIALIDTAGWHLMGMFATGRSPDTAILV